MADAHKNYAYSTVAVAPAPASSGTSLTVQNGDGARFPATPFNTTIWPAGVQPTSSNAEIARCTNIVSDTLTLTREQESTVAQSIVAGYQIEAGITAKTLTDIESGSPTYNGVTYTATTSADAIHQLAFVNNAAGVFRIIASSTSQGGQTSDCPFWPNGGTGSAYKWTVIPPSSSTGLLQNFNGSFTFSDASAVNTYTVTFTGASGALTIQRTGGLIPYTATLYTR